MEEMNENEKTVNMTRGVHWSTSDSRKEQKKKKITNKLTIRKGERLGISHEYLYS